MLRNEMIAGDSILLDLRKNGVDEVINGWQITDLRVDILRRLRAIIFFQNGFFIDTPNIPKRR